MLRLILRLFGIRDFDICKSCETLKEQLEYERAEKLRLTNTLLEIIHPAIIQQSPVQELRPVAQTSLLFSKRREALEERERQESKIKKESRNLGKPDIVTDPITTRRLETEKLESELGISETVQGA